MTVLCMELQRMMMNGIRNSVTFRRKGTLLERRVCKRFSGDGGPCNTFPNRDLRYKCFAQAQLSLLVLGNRNINFLLARHLIFHIADLAQIQVMTMSNRNIDQVTELFDNVRSLVLCLKCNVIPNTCLAMAVVFFEALPLLKRNEDLFELMARSEPVEEIQPHLFFHDGKVVDLTAVQVEVCFTHFCHVSTNTPKPPDGDVRIREVECVFSVEHVGTLDVELLVREG